MENTSSPGSKNQSTDPPAPEVLKPQSDASSESTETTSSATATTTPKTGKRQRRNIYRPSHKATFIGLGVVVAILAINAGIIAFVINNQNKSNSQDNQGQVTISQGVLDKLGVNRNSITDAGIELTVNPNASFKGAVQIGGDASIAGQLKLNSKLSASDASLTQLEAGNTTLAQLNVNGNGTLSTLNLRNDLLVAGLTKLQGAVTIGQLLTVNNNVNISGSLSLGGTLSVTTVHVSSFVSDSTVTVGGHFITRGSAPGVGAGPAVGSNGTVSISGSDMAGTVAVNTGTGAGYGIVANISFRSQYGTTPHVVITTVGGGIGYVYVNRSIGGFSIGVSGPIPPGGYAFDYIVMQ